MRSGNISVFKPLLELAIAAYIINELDKKNAMNKEFKAHGRQEREEILNENLIAANRKIQELQQERFELSIENVQQQKTIKYLTMSIVVITCVAIYFMFALGS